MDGDDSSNYSSSLSAGGGAAVSTDLNAYDVNGTKKKRSSPSAASNDDDGTKNLKRKERLEQNRISARESRKRKKNMIEELQRTVITLSREHKELTQRNETLKRQMVDLNEKVRKKILLFFKSCFDYTLWMLIVGQICCLLASSFVYSVPIYRVPW